MASSTYHKIMVQCGEDPTILEALAGEAGIGPGDLLEWSSGTFLRHNTANGYASPILIAIESPTNDPDSETSFAIDVDYDNGDTVYAWIPKPGDHAYMFLANGQSASQHSVLQSDGDGALVVQTTLDATLIANSVIGRALAALNNATGSPARILVEIA
jgi:hypothetical protein